MKNFFLILIGLLTTQFAMSQYYFSAQVSSSDPCCISIDAGSWSDEYNDQWWVEIDLNINDYYDNASNGNEFLHCVEGNGTYTVYFFVQGYAGPYWSRDVEVTGCSDDEGCDCDDCFEWLDDSDYAAHLSQIKNCVANGGSYKQCSMQAYQWYLQAYESNVQWRNDCLEGLEECNFIEDCW